jgi:hypothetical protein
MSIRGGSEGEGGVIRKVISDYDLRVIWKKGAVMKS